MSTVSSVGARPAFLGVLAAALVLTAYPLSGAEQRMVQSSSSALHGGDRTASPHAPLVYTVANCNRSGPGSLREAAGLAVDGDTIDLSQLTCDRIFVEQADGGQITVRNVLLRGPGRDLLQINGNGESRIFLHTGVGTLTIAGLTLVKGSILEDLGTATGSGGGCIYSAAGGVSLKYSTIEYCSYSAVTASPYIVAAGGAIRAQAISLDHSLVTGNKIVLADPDGQIKGDGGGIAANSISMVGSTIVNNWAGGNGGGASTITTGVDPGSVSVTNSTIADNAAGFNGGGLSMLLGELTISHSTISGNLALYTGGGIYVSEYNDFGPDSVFSRFSMVDSTVSGNSSGTGAGGASVIASKSLYVYNDTIVKNTSGQLGGVTAGLSFGQYESDTNELSSSIIAFNTASDGLGVDAKFLDSGFNHAHGSNNLILTGDLVDMPDAVHGCPRLSPLGDHGGPTKTHALAPLSPALDAGINAGGEDFDQRGRGFMRVVGAAADIGAYERQKTAADSRMTDLLTTIDAASSSCRPVTH